jgi:HSP20 family protein
MPETRENIAMNVQTTNGGPAAQATGGGMPTFMPPTDIYETKDAVIMFLEMPGADPGSLDVTLDRRTLKVSATSPSSAPQGYALVNAEYRDGAYERSFALSDQVEGDHVDAVFKDGVLRLTLPKASPTPAKKITVKSE